MNYKDRFNLPVALTEDEDRLVACQVDKDYYMVRYDKKTVYKAVEIIIGWEENEDLNLTKEIAEEMLDFVSVDLPGYP